MKCPNCNHENAADALHCTNCGIALSNNTEDEMKPAVSKNEKLAEIEKRRTYKKKKKQQKKIALIVLTVAISAGIISGAAYWISSSIIDKTDKEGTIVVTSKPTASAIPTRTPLAIPTDTPMPSSYPFGTSVPGDTQGLTPHDATGGYSSSGQAGSYNGTSTYPVSGQTGTNNSTSAYPSGNAQATYTPYTPSNSSSSVPKTTKKPTVTKAPAAQAKPKATVKPATPKPVVTAKPTPTAVPEPTPTPVPTEPPILRPLDFHPGGVASEPLSPEISTESFSQLMQVTDHVIDGNTGRSMIKFRAGNTDYFAYNDEHTVPRGSVGYFTATLRQSGYTYNGLPIYNMTDIADCRNGYILPNSNTTILSESDIAHLSKAQLRLARNEIFARHGRAFEGQELHEYFSSRNWYSINEKYDYIDDKINVTDLEWKNAEFLLNHSK